MQETVKYLAYVLRHNEPSAIGVTSSVSYYLHQVDWHTLPSNKKMAGT